jgi:type II secretory pathway component PulF
MHFKFIVSKNQKRYDLILQANSEIEARDKLHNEGYSILNAEQIDNLDILGSKFLFTVNKEGDIKN